MQMLMLMLMVSAHPQVQAAGSVGDADADADAHADADAESAQAEQRQETQMITTQVLALLLILPAIFAMAYQENVVRLATASCVALEPIVVESLAFIRYIIVKSLASIYYIFCLFRYYFEDWHAETSTRAYLASLDDNDGPNSLVDSSDSEDNDLRQTSGSLVECSTCGKRQAVSWLGDTECYECYSEH